MIQFIDAEHILPKKQKRVTMLELNPFKPFHNDLPVVETACLLMHTVKATPFVKIDRTLLWAKTWAFGLSRVKTIANLFLCNEGALMVAIHHGWHSCFKLVYPGM